MYLYVICFCYSSCVFWVCFVFVYMLMCMLCYVVCICMFSVHVCCIVCVCVFECVVNVVLPFLQIANCMALHEFDHSFKSCIIIIIVMCCIFGYCVWSMSCFHICWTFMFILVFGVCYNRLDAWVWWLFVLSLWWWWLYCAILCVYYLLTV